MNDFDTFIQKSSIDSVRMWMYLLAYACVIAGVVIWIFCGNMEVTVIAQGIILPARQVEHIEHDIHKEQIENKKILYLSKIMLTNKNRLYHQKLITYQQLNQAREEYQRAKSNISKMEQGEFETVGRDIDSSDNHGLENLMVIALLNNQDGRKAKSGMRVRILYGQAWNKLSNDLEGVVTYVSQDPVSKGFANTFFNNSSYIEPFFRYGNPYLLKIQLNKHQDKNKIININAGSIVSTEIITATASPYSLLFK